jgi:polygalacturonase
MIIFTVINFYSSDMKLILENITRFKQAVIICFLLAGPVHSKANPLVFNILDYGAKGDGVTLNTKSIQSAIEACSESGGGTIWFPSGKYLSGTIYLKSNVTLFLDAGAVLAGSKNLKDYPVTISKIRSYTDNYTDKSLIYGEGLEHIAVTGQGVIDGNGASYKYNGPFKDRPYMIRIINCKNVQIRDIHILNSAMWVQHYLSCEDVSITGISVNSRVNSNNDGIDIDGCDNVRISDCSIISGDDGIVLKSTLNKPCKNVTVTNCVISSDCNAFKLGTETNGDFQNITFSNCAIYDTHLAGITLQMVDGGTLDRVSISNVTMNNVGTALFIRLGNRARPFNEKTKKIGMGKLSNVIIDNVQATNAGKTGCSITGLPGYPVKNITLNNIYLTFEGGGNQELVKRDIPEVPEGYPEFEMFGTLPAYGFYCRHAENIRFYNVELGFENKEARPAIIFDDINGSELQSIKGRLTGSLSLLWFINVKNTLIQSCIAPEGIETFLKVSGSESKHITLSGNDLSGAKNAVELENNRSVFMDNNRLAIQSIDTVSHNLNCALQFTDDREIRISTPAAVKNKRLEIIRSIWDADKIPDRSDVVVTPDISSPLNPGSYLSRVDKIEIPVNAPVVEGAKPIKDLAYLFVPVMRNNRLVIINPGHACTLKTTPNSGSDFRIEETINGLLKKGFDVLAVYMPHVSDTTCNLDHCSIINTNLGPGNYPATFGLRFFLEPTIVSLNYALKQNNYQNVNMVGLSGGGWTTNLIAAIDDRIKYSFNIAGSMPLYYRYGSSMGDIEQYLPQLYRDIAGYPDLYILGSFGNGRKQVQILNRNDDCCFGNKQHDPDRDYDADLRTFEQSVKERLIALEAKDHYYLVIDETAPNHQISGYTLKNVILKELTGK